MGKRKKNFNDRLVKNNLFFYLVNMKKKLNYTAILTWSIITILTIQLIILIFKL